MRTLSWPAILAVMALVLGVLSMLGIYRHNDAAPVGISLAVICLALGVLLPIMHVNREV